MKILKLIAPLPHCWALRWRKTPKAFREAFLAGEVSWDEVIRARSGQESEVNWFHWGGSDELNTWIDTVVAPDLAATGHYAQHVAHPQHP